MGRANPFPLGLGGPVDSPTGLHGPELDEVDGSPLTRTRADASRWRVAKYLVPFLDTAADVRASYRSDDRRVWGIRVGEWRSRLRFQIGECAIGGDLSSLIATLGAPDYEAQVAPAVRQHHWLRGDTTYVAAAYTESTPVGFLQSLGVYSTSLGPPGFAAERDVQLRTSYVRTERPLAEFCAALARAVSLKEPQVGRIFNRPAATLHHADGSEALTVVEYPDLEMLEIEVRAPAASPLVEAVRREVEKLGTRL